MFRASSSVVTGGARLSVEADSLNAAVAGPDLGDSPDLFNQFVTDVFRDMTQKTGQKCTAIRRIFTPSELVEDVRDALVEMLETIQTGDPEQEGVSMGPVVSRTQLESVEEGIQRLREGNVELLWEGKATGERPGTGGKGFFVEPHLFCGGSATDPVVHGDEILGRFRPFSPHGTAEEVIDGPKAGEVASSPRCTRTPENLLKRWYWGRSSPWTIAFVLLRSRVEPADGSMAVHGGPGRAGGGEELGAARGKTLHAADSGPGISSASRERLRRSLGRNGRGSAAWRGP